MSSPCSSSGSPWTWSGRRPAAASIAVGLVLASATIGSLVICHRGGVSSSAPDAGGGTTPVLAGPWDGAHARPAAHFSRLMPGLEREDGGTIKKEVERELGATFRRLCAREPGMALHWLSALPVTLRQSLVGGLGVDTLFRRLVSHDARAAGNAIAEYPPDGIGSALASRYALYLASDNIAWALEWAESLPYANARQAALREVIVSWLRIDLHAAEDYLEGIPPGRLRSALAAEIETFRGGH